MMTVIKLKHWWRRQAGLCRRNESGIALVETVVAIGLLGGVALAFISGLSTGSLAAREQGEETVAQRLAQSQQETIKAASYDSTGASYAAVTAPTGYSIGITVNSALYADSNIQKITVTISHNGVTVLTNEAYKVNR